MDSVRSHTADEIVQMMKKTPLFMTHLDDTADGQEENIQIEALKALQYEGSRAEIALGFKERGNEMVAEKRWGDAKEFYTKGIAALKVPATQVEASASEDEQRKEREKERKLEEACYVNRALCNLELRMSPHPLQSLVHSFTPPRLSSQNPPPNTKPQTHIPHTKENPQTDPKRTTQLKTENFRSTLLDTRHTLLLNPSNTKAHYRAALALLSLSSSSSTTSPSSPAAAAAARFTEALDLVHRAMALTNPSRTSTNIAHKPSAEHAAFTTLRARLLAAQTAHAALTTKHTSAQERTRAAMLARNAALHARGIRVRVTPHPPDLEDAGIVLQPAGVGEATAAGELWFPVLVLYPCHARSDFLKAVAERSTWGEVLETVLPVEWDVAGEYLLLSGGGGGGGVEGGGGGGAGGGKGKGDRGKGDREAEGGKGKGVECFLETREGGGMMKVGRKVTLLDVLKGGKVEVVDQVVTVFVVPRARVSGWVEEMKARHGRRRM
ncbi:MAG: hypothetical protein Q9202_004095 [Teloschistes flavicans]